MTNKLPQDMPEMYLGVPTHAGEYAPTSEDINGNEIGIATATFYPTWGNEGGESSTDNIRGNLALSTIAASRSRNFQLVAVDGGSSPAFLSALEEIGVEAQPEKERGMSAGRRQAFEGVSALEGVKVVCWTEPEKISIIEDCIPRLVVPILEGQADIVVPRRDEAAFATYPDYQAEFEIQSNIVWNNILRRHHLLASDAPDIDAWIGPRMFRNDPEIVKLFREKYEFTGTQAGLSPDTPELWPNAIFLPLVAALKQGYRIQSVDVPYRHPASQTANEQDNDTFRAKRAFQQEVILRATIHFIRMLEQSPQARIHSA